MAAIPEFQRQRLASAAVGTPGVDLSRAQIQASKAGLLGTIGKVGTALAGESFEALEGLQKQEAKEAAQRLKEQTAMETDRAAREEDRARMRARDDAARQAHLGILDKADSVTRSNRKLGDFQLKLGQARQGARDPDAFNTTTQELMDSFLEGEDSPEFLTHFTNQAREIVASENSRLLKDMEERKIQSVQNNLTESFEGIGKGLVDVFSAPSASFDEKMHVFEESVQSMKRNLDHARPILDPKEYARLGEESAKQAVQSGVNALMESNPDQVEAFLNHPSVRAGELGILTSEEITDIRKTAKEYADKRRFLVEEQQRTNRLNAESAFGEKALSDNPPTEEEIQRAVILGEQGLPGGISPGFAKALKDYRKSTKTKQFAGDNPMVYGQLDQEFTNIGAIKKGKLVVKDEAGIFERMAVFRQHVMESMAAGSITKSQGAQWLRVTSSSIDKGIEDIVGEVNKVTTVKDWWFDEVTQIFTEPSDIAQAQAEFQTELLERIDKAEQDEGPLSLGAVGEIVNQMKDDFQLRTNPNRSIYRVGQTYTDEQGAFKVIGFDTDGEPLTSSDLNARPLIPFAEKPKSEK